MFVVVPIGQQAVEDDGNNLLPRKVTEMAQSSLNMVSSVIEYPLRNVLFFYYVFKEDSRPNTLLRLMQGKSGQSTTGFWEQIFTCTPFYTN